MFIFQTNTKNIIIFAGIFKLLLQEEEEDLGEINETIYLFIFHLHILSERVKLNLWNYFANFLQFSKYTRKTKKIFLIVAERTSTFNTVFIP
jgi:hypothetical protein